MAGVNATDLEVDEDPAFQRWDWKLQNAGRFVIAALLAGALLGVFGKGWLAQGRVTKNGMTVQYDRISRHLAPSRVEITLPDDERARDVDTLAINREFAEAVTIEQIIPEPEYTAAIGDVVEFRFRNPGAAGTQRVVIRVKPARIGFIEARLTRGSMSEPLVFSMLILP